MGILKATHSGEIKIGEISIPCYVLEDGTRLISGRGMQVSLGFSKETSGNRLKQILNKKTFTTHIKDFIWKKFENSIQFSHPDKTGFLKTANGNEATLLIDVADLFMELNKLGLLTTAEEKLIATQSEILIRAVAKVGIISLIDEATGYQEVRDKNALQKILDKYLRPEYANWSKKFPDEFWLEIFRLNDWQYVGMKISKRPGVVGKYVNDIVYSRLAPGILEELQKKNPDKKVRHHQWLTDEVGHPALQQHLYSIIALMRISTNWRKFIALMNRAYPKFDDTIAMNLEVDEDNNE